MKKPPIYHFKIMEDIMKSIPLETSLYVHFSMNDIDNWHNGEYLGDKDKIKKEVEDILEMVNEWILNGMPK